MFLPTSRYANQVTVQATNSAGKSVAAVTLRRLPPTAGAATEISGTDRLDVFADRQYGDPTRFWHIADANTELQANDLLKPPDKEEIKPTQIMINVPGT